MAKTQRAKKRIERRQRPAADAGPAPVAARMKSPLIKPGKQERIVICAVLAMAFVSYLTSLGGAFVYDDAFQILKNPTLKSVSNIPAMFTQGVWQFMDSSSAGAVGLYYRPLFNSLLIINYSLFGLNPFGWHLVSVAFHVASTFLVYVLAREWKVPRDVSAAAALLFAVHPVHSESVAWISGVPDPLAGVFVLISLICYCRYYREPRSGRGWILASLSSAALAMLAKEVAITLPVVIALFELADNTEGQALRSRVARAARRAIPMFAVAAGYLLARYAVLGFINKPEIKAASVTTSEVLLTIPSVLVSYVRLLVVPFPLAVIYDHPYVRAAGDPRFWASLTFVLAVGGALIWLVRKSTPARRALIVLSLFLIPVLNLKAFNPEESIVHDRYLYLPSIGFCILLALGFDWLRERAGSLRKLAPVTFAVVVVVLFGLLVNQNTYWSNDVAMAEHAIEGAPNKAFLYNYLGAHYGEQNKLPDAERYFTKAIQISPGYYDAYSNLGDIYFKRQNWSAAEGAYKQAVEAGAPYSQTYYNLGDVLARQNKFSEARSPFIKVLEIQPNKAEAVFYLAWLDQQQGKPGDAEKLYSRALQIKPDYVEARINLGVVLTDEGRTNEAIEQLELARRSAPSHPIMLYTLGEAYRKSDRIQDAIATLNQLISSEPRHPRAYTGLGLCYEKQGNTSKARDCFQKAIEIAPADAYTATAREHLQKLT